MTDEQLTLGEIHRTLQRLETSLNRLTERADTFAAMRVTVDRHEDDITDLQKDMKGVRRDAAFLSGGSATLAFVLSLFFGKH